MFNKLKKLCANNKGATAVEYGLIVSLIVVACIASMGSFGNRSTGMWIDVADKIIQD